MDAETDEVVLSPVLQGVPPSIAGTGLANGMQQLQVPLASATETAKGVPPPVLVWTKATVHPNVSGLTCAADQSTVIGSPLYCLDNDGFSTANGGLVNPPCAVFVTSPSFIPPVLTPLCPIDAVGVIGHCVAQRCRHAEQAQT